MPDKYPLNFPRVHGYPVTEGVLRSRPEDFFVEESLGFDLAGHGEHLCLLVEKRNQNTRWVAALLAKWLGVDESTVGYCGQKDRRAVTRQWFSVQSRLPEQNIDPRGLGQDIKILQIARHSKKLRRGMHAGNRFEICLRDVQGQPVEIEQRLDVIADQGIPNYFGEQRFGLNGRNLAEADRLLAERNKGRQRQKGGIYLSAARSYLFNLVLAQRVENHTWNEPFLGEIHPDGPLWGRGRSRVSADLRDWETEVLSEFSAWRHALEHAGLEQQRRDLVLRPQNLTWSWPDKASLKLGFELPAGSYATSLLRELALWIAVDR